MDFNYLTSLYPIFGVICILIQFIILGGDSNKKYNYIIKSMSLGLIIINSIIYSFILFTIIETWDISLILVIVTIIELIIFFVSFIFYRKQTKQNKKFLIAFCIFIILTSLILFVIPQIVNPMINYNKVENALITAHGDLGFKVVDYDYTTSDNGIISTSITGISYKVQYLDTNYYFIVQTYSDSSIIKDDEFLALYYSIELGFDTDYNLGFSEYYDYIENIIEEEYNTSIQFYKIYNSDYGALNYDGKINTIEEITYTLTQYYLKK